MNTATGWSLLFALLTAVTPAICANPTWYLSDHFGDLQIRHQQQWGELGRGTAAAAVGRAPSAMRIGTRTYVKGIGHHANGEISVTLDGQFTEFFTSIGVQWQGGHKGSVLFSVEVDGKTVFRSEPLSDSDPAQDVHVPLTGARQLKLIARDAGDGIACDMANWADARVIRSDDAPFFGNVSIRLDRRGQPMVSRDHCGLSLVAHRTGPQVAVMEPINSAVVELQRDERAECDIAVEQVTVPLRFSATARALGTGKADVTVTAGDLAEHHSLVAGDTASLHVTVLPAEPADQVITLAAFGIEGDVQIQWSDIRCKSQAHQWEVPLRVTRPEPSYPPPVLPALRPHMEQVVLEWDWRLQDGIDTARCSQTWEDATIGVLECGDRLIHDLRRTCELPAKHLAHWQELKQQVAHLAGQGLNDPDRWEDVWKAVHQARRQIVLDNPLSEIGPLVFAKRVPSCFSHQLTQYYGMCARPGGGIFVLEQPGRSMRCRELTDLPPGSYQHPEVSWDGRRVLFSYCHAESAPESRSAHQDRHFHLMEMHADGSHPRQLTAGDFDDFSPRYLPDDRLLFLSTRRGGFHRCGAGPCPVYTLTTAEADGSNPHPISYHETHEWDPAILSDGRIIYTRWDYVDRHAVHYQQLWSCLPDGSHVAAYFGNNTLNPVGVWEARPVPNSHLVMATAGAHHAMTAGSIILLDITRGIDGLDPITRLTPDALFPESEAPVQRWHATAGLQGPVDVPIPAQRWPGHCYRSSYPLSPDYFLAAYSFDPLIGEPNANKANMFGIYLVDRFGNKELLYRDLNISSLWPIPLRPRRRPPVLPTTAPGKELAEGRLLVQNVYDSWPALPQESADRIRQLRIVQVLPKTTPHINTPRVGLANASPGRQVLGTVPVEEDGSAYFRAPAKVPLAFQALDQHGMAVQTMRSLTYLQPGEQISCVGCHEHRARTPETTHPVLAMQRPPSDISPGPDGSRPFSYPILVQGVLDRHCVSCHGEQDPAGGIVLTGSPQGAFCASYNALIPFVAFSQWNGTPANNHEPLTMPDQFGARASRLTQLLTKGHEDVSLNNSEWQRLITWMDTNGLFYGTFDPADQARQLHGQRIAGPALE